MFNLKKNVFALILITSFVLFLASSPFIQALEVEYPEVGGWRPETVEQAVLPQYIKYIFTFSVAIAGLVAFGALIYGGFRYITSAGAPTAQTEAKDQIFSGVIGLAILLSSYLILTTINPQLVLLKSPKLLTVKGTEIPGVYLSTEVPFPTDEGAKVYHLTSSIDDLRAMVDDEIRTLKIVNRYKIEVEGKPVITKPDFYYGAVLYEKKNQEGSCAYARSFDSPEKTLSLTSLERPINPSSITVFQEVEKSDGKVTICSAPDGGGKCIYWDKGTKARINLSTNELDRNVWSIKIEGNYLVVLQGETPSRWSWGGTTGDIQCKAFTSSVSDLKGYLMNSCNPHTNAVFFFGWAWYDSCATYVDIYPIY